MYIFTEERLRSFARAALEMAGLTADEAQICSDVAAFADLRGTDTHGIMYVLPRTLDSLASGRTVSAAQMVTRKEEGATALVSGNGLAGPVLGYRSMSLAIDKARHFGVGMVVASNGNALGPLGYYPTLALPHGLFGLAMANTSPSVAPFGGVGRLFGTNPFAFAAPAGTQHGIIFDAASSVAAAGKLSRARRRGEKIPVGWVIDSNGKPITDPDEAQNGAMLPFGEHKGSGIALLVHLLTGMLAGTTVGGELTHDHPDPKLRGQSSMFMAIDPDFFCSRATFEVLVQLQIEMIHASPPEQGRTRVLVPGERGWQEEDRRRAHGIPLADEDWLTLVDSCRDARLPEADLIARFGPVHQEDRVQSSI